MPKGGKQIPSAHDGRPVALYVRVPSLYPQSFETWGETAESKTDYFGPYSDEYRYVPVATGTDWGGL